MLKREWAWTYTPSAASSSELTRGVKLLECSGRGLLKKKYDRAT